MTTNNGNANQRKKTLLDDWRQPHPSTLQPMAGGTYPAQGLFQQKANGNIVFKINDGSFNRDQKVNHKEVELNYSDRGNLFRAVIDAATMPDFGTKQMVIAKKQWIRAGGQSKISDNPIVQAMFTIIRDAAGVVTLVYTKGDYKAALVFRGANDTVLYMKNDAGEKVEDRGTMSRWAARTWVKFHEGILNDMETAAWEPAPPREQKNNTQSGQSEKYNDNDSSFADTDF